MNKAKAIEMVRGAGLGEDGEALVKLFAPSARLVKGDGNGGCYLGGLPRMPEGTAWPVWDSAGHMRRRIADAQKRLEKRPGDVGLQDYLEGMRRGLGPLPLAFLGQLDLREISTWAPLPGWPERGTLAFFYERVVSPWGFDPEDRGSFRVLYFPEGVALVEVEAPEELEEDFLSPHVPMRVAAEWTLPTEVGPEKLRDTQYVRAHMGLLEKLSGAVDGSGVIHRCGGHPDEVQGEMRLGCQLASHGIYCGDPSGYTDPRRPALEAGKGEWELLFQVDSDEDELGWMWGDMGRLYFWIRREELGRLEFGNVWGVMQCS